MVVSCVKNPDSFIDAVTVGFTVMVKDTGAPVHPLADVGVTVMFATTGLAPLFIAVNGGMFPVLPGPRPIPGVSLTQLTTAAIPVKLITGVSCPFVNNWLPTGFNTGSALIKPLTATWGLEMPGDDIVT